MNGRTGQNRVGTRPRRRANCKCAVPRQDLTDGLAPVNVCPISEAVGVWTLGRRMRLAYEVSAHKSSRTVRSGGRTVGTRSRYV